MFRFGLDENMKKRATKRVDGKIAANFRISGRKSLYYPKNMTCIIWSRENLHQMNLVFFQNFQITCEIFSKNFGKVETAKKNFDFFTFVILKTL